MLIALSALAPVSAHAAPNVPPERSRHLFILRIQGGTADDINYAVYRAAPGDPSGLVVQRSRGVLFDDARVEVSASACTGLRAAVETLATVPWPSLYLGAETGQAYLERGQFTAYTFYGALDHAGAMSWETKLHFVDVHGQPRDPFVMWAGELVRTVDSCLANRG